VHPWFQQASVQTDHIYPPVPGNGWNKHKSAINTRNSSPGQQMSSAWSPWVTKYYSWAIECSAVKNLKKPQFVYLK